ncbi:MAG TPA: nucleotidyltransferase family protein [Thermoanaerobaculia bacterium]|nr:nucleotidyltransferase family protein [Thermoanaerobaculia bacterium]
MSPDRAPAGSVAGVLLAAGPSSRMGRNKLLLRLDGESVLRRAAGRALAAGLDPVLVVLGHEAQTSAPELEGLPCRTIVNPDYALGMNSSARAGISAVPPEAAAAVVLLADMPLVTAEMLAALVERYRGSDAPLVISEYGGVQAPPTLYDRSLFPELGPPEGEGCGKRVVRRHRGEAEVFSWPAAALADLDRPEDYERIKAGIEAGRDACAATS